MRAARGVLGLAGVLLLLAAGCGGSTVAGGGAGARAAAAPPQLKSIGQLRAAFNSAAREPTLVVLISPT